MPWPLGPFGGRAQASVKRALARPARMDGPSQRPPDSLSLAAVSPPRSAVTPECLNSLTCSAYPISVSIPPTSRTLLSCAASHYRPYSLSLHIAYPHHPYHTKPYLFERVLPSLSSHPVSLAPALRQRRACPRYFLFDSSMLHAFHVHLTTLTLSPPQSTPLTPWSRAPPRLSKRPLTFRPSVFPRHEMY